MYQLIDSHAHLEELENLEAAIERAKHSGIVAIISVGSDYSSNHQVLEIAEKYKSYVYPALGCHPGRLKETALYLDRNLQFIKDNIENIVAIGEIGLDYHKRIIGECNKDLQKSVLRSILELAKRYRKPVIIHSRYAWRDSLTLVKDIGVEKAVFHWYTGPLNVLRDILEQGYLVSATLAAEYHEEHKRGIKEARLESLLLETDSPVVYRGGTDIEHKAEPADVVRVLDAVAKLKGVEPGIVANKTTENSLSFYEIPTAA